MATEATTRVEARESSTNPEWLDDITRIGRTSWARKQARALLAECDIRSPRDIRIDRIAKKLDVALETCALDGADAELVRFGDRVKILISERMSERAAIRFAIAHELGHLFLKHPSPKISQLAGRGFARRHAFRSLQHEAEADAFASELLMPEWFLGPLCEHAPVDLEIPRWIASTYNVSLLASAIRFTELSTAPCAAVFAARGRVKWAAESRAFPRRIVHGRLLHGSSLAARYFVDGALADEPVHAAADAWLDPPARGEIVEHATCSHQYRTVLSMLWFRDEQNGRATKSCANASAIAMSSPEVIRRI